MFALPEDIRGNGDRVLRCSSASIKVCPGRGSGGARQRREDRLFLPKPVPAFGKTLTEEEKRVAGDLSYGDLYRQIVAGMMTLRERGLAMYDLGDIFANQKGTIYADHIHYWRDAAGESPGNRLIAARIAQLLSETWGLQKKP
jgi:hypothetical protein